MPEPGALDTDPAAPASSPPATPRVSGEGAVVGARVDETPLPESSLRAAQGADDAAAVSEPTDTLLSAGKPADRLELLLEDRLLVVDERLRELDARIATLEQQKAPIATPEPHLKPWLWIAFLIALVVVFQLLHRVR